MAMDLGFMKTSAVAVLVLAAVVLTALAVVQGFKDTNLVDNTTADNFISGLGYYGTFIGIIVLAIIGKIIIGLFTKGKDNM